MVSKAGEYNKVKVCSSTLGIICDLKDTQLLFCDRTCFTNAETLEGKMVCLHSYVECLFAYRQDMVLTC